MSSRYLELCNALVEECQVQDRDPQFFSTEKIHSLLNVETIIEVLGCDCQTSSDLASTNPSNIPNNLAEKIVGDAQDGTSVLLFATLVHIKCPLILITEFFLQDPICRDADVHNNIEQFDATWMCAEYWKELHASNTDLTTEYASKFEEAKYQFFIPVLTSDKDEEFPRRMILPFVNKRKISIHGHYGDVYAVEIPREFRRFGLDSDTCEFAVKEPKADGSGIREKHNLISREADNLEQLARIGDKHIARIFKSFKHDGVPSIISPRARTDLGQYLHEPEAAEIHSGSLENHPFWSQMLGIAVALYKVLYFQARDPNGDKILRGFHLDLKPANILIDESGHFILSDFGFAYLERFKEGTPLSLRLRGGDYQYAPPENDDPRHPPLTREYDVWSLGCILLEVAIFVISDYQALAKFQLNRATQSTFNASDDRFFKRYLTGGSELKRSVINAIDSLTDEINDASSRGFVLELQVLLKNMLQVDVTQRWNCIMVCERLFSILNRYQQDSLDPSASLSDRVEIGRVAMMQIPRVKYQCPGFWHNGPVRIVQERNELILLAWQPKSEGENEYDWVESHLGGMLSLDLIPTYAFAKTIEQDQPRMSIQLQEFDAPFSDDAAMKTFSCESLDQICHLQEALLGQQVKHFEIRHCKPIMKVGFWKSTVLKEPTLFPDKARSVQLWTCLDEHDASYKRQFWGASVTRDTPSPPRIVIFFDGSILILKMDVHFSIEEPATSLMINFIPTNKTFPGLVIKQRNGEGFSRLPLNRESLERWESDDLESFKGISFECASQHDANRFKQAYMEMRRQWLEEYEETV